MSCSEVVIGSDAEADLVASEREVGEVVPTIGGGDRCIGDRITVAILTEEGHVAPEAACLGDGDMSSDGATAVCRGGRPRWRARDGTCNR